MKPKIALIDYGMGNLRSVGKALELAGADVIVTGNRQAIKSAQALVLPGGGSFGPAIEYLRSKRIEETVIREVNSGKPYLGLCLGFQFLFSSSEENGNPRGFNIIKGEVVKFRFSSAQNVKRKLKIPHMGWNRVRVNPKAENIFHGIPDNSYFYFVHSYYAVPENKKIIAGSTDYGVNFCSAIENGNIWACQFHPEKSGELGIRLLKNFVNGVKKC
jgi:imidazole glycerol-phosphate synthase subunit HisH